MLRAAYRVASIQGVTTARTRGNGEMVNIVEEYQKQNVYNQMLKFLIKISIIPALIFAFSAIVFRLNAITFFCLICFLGIAYFIFS